MDENNMDAEQLDESKKGGAFRTAVIGATATVLVTAISTIGVLLKDRSDSKEQFANSAPATVTTTQTVTPSPAPEPLVHRAIISPEENTAVPLCADVKGSYDPLPEGKTIVVAVQEDEDTRIYFEQSVKFLGKGQWAARVNLGDLANPAAAVKHRFSIYAVAINKPLAEYLADTNAEEGDTWWSSTAWPPGADRGEATRVVRSALVGPCE
jgi:hypothetical protein